MLIPYFFNFLCISFYSISVFAAISWCGELYLKLDNFNLKENSLLENLKEGVYILDENTKFVLFQNKMAKKYNVLLQQSFSACDVKESDVIDISWKQFTLVPTGELLKTKNLDSEDVLKVLLALDNYISMEQVIAA